MLAPLLAIAVATAMASDGGVRAEAAGADTASVLSKEEVCRLVVLAARKEVVRPTHRTNLLAQPITSRIAGERGRIWMDVGVREHGRLRYPFARGESCGDQVLVELCDGERQGDRCSRNRKDRERWRVQIVLTVIDDDHVDSVAALVKPLRVHRHTTEAAVSPVPDFFGHFERGHAGWREGVNAMAETPPGTGDVKSAGADAGAR